ncbi:NnrU family protein [Marinobacterium aestuariivivens]|uniref:NnrU family protein n=1 Tax=Marinobacterium aestuariivivens TaxID=1698799 RepID=A0ABW2A3I3_9GAMM
MAQMLIGIVLFFAVHLLPLFTSLRQRLIDRWGRWPYLGVYSLISLAGLVLMVRGYRAIEPDILWGPFGFGRLLAHGVMPLALVLVVAAYLPTFTKHKLRHPMLIGVALWSGGHLLANGDLASTWLFAPFLVYALLDIAFSRPRRTLIPVMQPKVLFDVLAVIVGLLLYSVLIVSHGQLFGVALLA